jgi:hypothetical protein
VFGLHTTTVTASTNSYKQLYSYGKKKILNATGFKIMSKLEKNRKQSHAKAHMLLVSPHMQPVLLRCILSNFNMVVIKRTFSTNRPHLRRIKYEIRFFSENVKVNTNLYQDGCSL